MKHLLLALVCTLVVSPCLAADINVTVATKGTTFIEWQWDAGYDLTHILIDGIEICGYETTNNSIIRSDLQPDSLHSINVSTLADSGYGITRTLPNVTADEDIVDYSSDAAAAAYGVVGGLLTSVLVVKRWKKDS